MKEKATGDKDKKALAVKHSFKKSNPRRLVICHYCKKSRHIKRECRKLAAANQRQTNEEASKPKHSARNAAAKEQVSSSTSDDEAMVVNHALAATHSSENWIVDSGATCHMCNDKTIFRELRNLSEP